MIRIATDSTCDLPASVLEQYHIDLVPLIVMKEDEEFLDNVTITPGDIFTHVKYGGALCSTAARSVAVYQELFSKFAGDYDGVLHISLGSGFSSSCQNANLAAQSFSNVRVLDSQSLSSGHGLMVLKAAQLSQEGMALENILEELETYRSKIDISFVLDRLDYMAKGGRCSTATALGANLLNLKPCIELREGKMSVGKKYRGHFDKCLTHYIQDKLGQQEDIDQIIAAVQEAIAQFAPFATVYEAEAGCTVSCHCGPNTLGIIFARV